MIFASQRVLGGGRECNFQSVLRTMTGCGSVFRREGEIFGSHSPARGEEERKTNYCYCLLVAQVCSEPGINSRKTVCWDLCLCVCLCQKEDTRSVVEWLSAS